MSLESINRFVELTGRTSRTIKNRLKTLTPVKKGNACLYESREALPLIFDLGEDGTPQKSMTRLNNLRSDEIDHRLQKAKLEVAPIETLTWALNNVSQQINSVLDSLPLKLKKRCPKLTARDIENIRREIVKAQNAASEATLSFPD